LAGAARQLLFSVTPIYLSIYVCLFLDFRHCKLPGIVYGQTVGVLLCITFPSTLCGCH